MVLADGFYEWVKKGKHKLPYRFTLKEPGPFAFAGLWDVWLDKETGEELRTFTIITTTANELVSPVHERMPVILNPEHEATWLNPELLSPEQLNEILVPYPAQEMQSFRVSTQVNSPRNDDPGLIQPVEEQSDLFGGEA
jgi:putative SOS response-associated peptidase YedK